MPRGNPQRRSGLRSRISQPAPEWEPARSTRGFAASGCSPKWKWEVEQSSEAPSSPTPDPAPAPLPAEARPQAPPRAQLGSPQPLGDAGHQTLPEGRGQTPSGRGRGAASAPAASHPELLPFSVLPAGTPGPAGRAPSPHPHSKTPASATHSATEPRARARRAPLWAGAGEQVRGPGGARTPRPRGSASRPPPVRCAAGAREQRAA